MMSSLMRSVLVAATLVSSGLAAGVPPAYHFDPNTDPRCSVWHNNDGQYACWFMPSLFDITPEEFIAWNPSISYDTCSPWNLEQSYCVGICTANCEASSTSTISSKTRTLSSSSTSTEVPPSTTTAAPTTPSPDNGIPTPTPIQSGMVGNCNKFYKVASGDTCQRISALTGASVNNVIKWNPAIHADCTGLWLDYYVCIAVVEDSSSSAPTTTNTITTGTSQPATTTATQSTSSTTSAGNGVVTPTPIQPGMVSDCDAFYKVVSGDTCDKIASSNGISVSDLTKWNPEVGATCTGLWVEYYVCVSVLGHTPSPTTTTPGNGIATPTPIQPGMVSNCDAFYKVVSGDTCDKIASSNGISVSDITKWNPQVGATCTGIWVDYYICVSIVGHTPSTPTTTAPGNGIATPTPIQPGMVSNCDAFYKVVSGDTCDKIASSNGISVSDITKWNPQVGATCTGIWVDYYICVSIVGHTPSPTTPGNGVTTPTPIQPGMATNCDAFHKVVSGDTCDKIASGSGISVSDLTKWNPQIGATCTGLWLDYYVCVSVIGHTPSPTTPGNGVTTPTPIQNGMTTNCKKFHLIVSGDTCDTLASKYGVTTAQIVSWNGAAGPTCSGLWAGYYACVGV